MANLFETIILKQLSSISGGYLSGLVSTGIDQVNNQIKQYFKKLLMSVFMVTLMTLSAFISVIFTVIHFSEFNLSSEIFKSVLSITIPVLVIGLIYIFSVMYGKKNITNTLSKNINNAFSENINKTDDRQDLEEKIKSQDLQIQKLEEAFELILRDKFTKNNKSHNVA